MELKEVSKRIYHTCFSSLRVTAVPILPALAVLPTRWTYLGKNVTQYKSLFRVSRFQMSGSIIGDHSIEIVDINSSGKCIAANNQLKMTSLKLVQHLAGRVFTRCKMARWTKCFRQPTFLLLLTRLCSSPVAWPRLASNRASLRPDEKHQ